MRRRRTWRMCRRDSMSRICRKSKRIRLSLREEKHLTRRAQRTRRNAPLKKHSAPLRLCASALENRRDGPGDSRRACALSRFLSCRSLRSVDNAARTAQGASGKRCGGTCCLWLQYQRDRRRNRRETLQDVRRTDGERSCSLKLEERE